MRSLYQWKQLSLGLTCAGLAVLLLGPARPAWAQPPSPSVQFQYEQPKSATYLPMAQVYRQGLLESYCQVVIHPERYRFPKPLVFGMTEMGNPNAFYSGKLPGIVISYELISQVNQLFKRIEPEQSTRRSSNAVAFFFLHEFGHLLIDQFDLPIPGREEDAVDDFAAISLIEMGGRGKECVEAAALYFMYLGQNEMKNPDFADEHSLSLQRFYTLVGLLYAADPQEYQALVDKLGMTSRNLVFAKKDFERKKRAWERLLAPYRK